MGGREVSRPYRVWFFAEGERFLSFWRCHRPRKRAALERWCGWFTPLLEIRHAAALTTGAKHWHRQKAVFYVFCFCAPSIYPLNRKIRWPKKWRTTKRNKKQKSCKSFDLQDFVAEREGFEPPEPLSSTVFKTAAIDHSAISPMTFDFLKASAKIRYFLKLQNNLSDFLMKVTKKW